MSTPFRGPGILCKERKVTLLVRQLNCQDGQDGEHELGPEAHIPARTHTPLSHRPPHACRPKEAPLAGSGVSKPDQNTTAAEGGSAGRPVRARGAIPDQKESETCNREGAGLQGW